MANKKQTTEEKKTGFAKVNEVADYLRVSKHAIYRAIKSGQLAATQVGGSLRLKWEEIDALHQVVTSS